MKPTCSIDLETGASRFFNRESDSLVTLKSDIICIYSFRFGWCKRDNFTKNELKIYQFMPRYAMIKQKIIATKVHKYSILRSFRVMIKILFVRHGTMADSRDLSALVGQNGANHGFWDSGVLRFCYDWGNEKEVIKYS